LDIVYLSENLELFRVN